MRRGNSRGGWKLFLFLLAGVIIGGLVGQLLSSYLNSDIFQKSFQIGTEGNPTWIDLSVIRVAFGLTLNINFGTVLGLILGLFFYFRS